jgi:hypothetical protein
MSTSIIELDEIGLGIKLGELNHHVICGAELAGSTEDIDSENTVCLLDLADVCRNVNQHVLNVLEMVSIIDDKIVINNPEVGAGDEAIIATISINMARMKGVKKVFLKNIEAAAFIYFVKICMDSKEVPEDKYLTSLHINHPPTGPEELVQQGWEPEDDK